MAFDVSPSDVGNVIFDDLYGSLYVKPAPTLTYETNTQMGGALVKKVNVSAISVFVISDSKHTVLGHRPTYAMLRDGAKLILTNNCIGGLRALDQQTSQGHAYNQWTFDEPIAPADIVSLNFDGVTVPLQ